MPENIRKVVDRLKDDDEDIKTCIGMCLTDANEQRFKDYGTNLKDCLAWLEKQKVIDTDLLRKEIEKGIRNCDVVFERDYETYDPDAHYQGKAAAYQEILSFIDSHQQEQPDCHTVEDWIQHIKNADQLTKDIFSKGPYDVLYDALNHPYRHCYDAIKEFGELCFQVGVNSVKQEQPEVDLKKGIKEWVDLMVGTSFPEQDGDFISEEDYRDVIRQTAYHFYELGLNAKEE